MEGKEERLFVCAILFSSFSLNVSSKLEKVSSDSGHGCNLPQEGRVTLFKNIANLLSNLERLGDRIPSKHYSLMSSSQDCSVFCYRKYYHIFHFRTKN